MLAIDTMMQLVRISSLSTSQFMPALKMGFSPHLCVDNLHCIACYWTGCGEHLLYDRELHVT